MAKVLIVGDSQAQGRIGPGYFAEKKLQAAGHTVRRVANHGKGPIDYVNTPTLWSAYTQAVSSFRPDVIILIYGSNDFGSRLSGALTRMKNAFPQPVWMSGPPQYPDPDRQALARTIRTTNEQVFGARWIDAYPFTPLSIPRDSPMRAHFPGEGGRPWGEAIANTVMRSLPGAGTHADEPVPDGGGGGAALGPPEGAGRLALAAAGAIGTLGLLWWLLRRPVRRNRHRR